MKSHGDLPPSSFHKLWVHNESNITWPTLEKPNVQAKEVYFQDWVCWCMVIDFLRVRFAHAFQCRSCFTHKEKNSFAGFFSSFPLIAGHLSYNGFRTYSLCRRIFICWYNDTAASRWWACETSIVARSDERRLYSQASVTQTSVTQTSKSTVVLFTLFTFTIEGCLDSKLISVQCSSCKKSL